MKRHLQLVLMASLLSLINLSLGDSDLRISLGIIVLIVGLLIHEDIRPIPLSLYTGVGVFITRLIQTSFNTGLNGKMILSFSLEIFFYLAYGALFDFLIRKDDPDLGNPVILLLMICDFGANTVESLIRYSVVDFGLVTENFSTIFLAAFIRSALIWITWRILTKYTRIGEEKKL
ncbi:hypothetical protein [Lagierella sp.]|uniref:hypothetical protein n=1 Tax=Lagierella sp. TaxID=2849657 RepID=UPI0026285368|nr:hypothetical protein [Lagierella sp.]